jgi:hypothetical protein
MDENLFVSPEGPPNETGAPLTAPVRALLDPEVETPR